MEEVKIIRLINLIRFLDSPTANKQAKKEEIKYFRDRGIITEEDAIELTVEFC